MAEPLPGRPAPQSASSEALPVEAARDFLNGLKRPCRLLVAYSGGGDSTGLLVALAAAAKADPDVSLIAATVDHRLRPGSTEEALAAGALCASLSIPHHVLPWHGDKPKSGIQAAAREARYRLLGALAQDIGADLIVTAHTLDDQAETMAMRRSRNPEASAGISEAVLYDRDIWIFRPFLGLRRADIRVYLLSQDIGWVEDPSNENDVFERVRVRKALATDSVFSPRGEDDRRADEGAHHPDSPLIASHSLGTSPRWGEEGASGSLGDQEAATASFLISNVTIHSAMVAVIDLADYSPDNPAHLAAIRQLAAMLGGRTHAGGRDTGERIAHFLGSPDERRLTAERVVFDRRRQHLYISRERRSLPDMVIDAGSTTIWDNRFRIRNGGDAPVRICAGEKPGAETILFPDLHSKLPAGVRQRALAAAPAIFSGQPGKLGIEPVIAQFDRFLPLRMLVVANALAFLVGLDHFSALPTR